MKVNRSELLRRTIKYLLMAFILVLSIKYVPSNSLSNNEIIMVTTIGVVGFAILDLYCPAVSNSNIEHLLNN